MKINGLHGFRYSITELPNVASTWFSLPRLSSLHVTMSSTYSQLIDTHIARLHAETTSKHVTQMARNHMTALRGFLTSVGKRESSPIGNEMVGEFDTTLKAHLSTVDIGERSKRDRRSILTSWRQTFERMGATPDEPVRGRERRQASSPPLTMTPFEHGLREALKHSNLTPKRAALVAGISTSALGRWSRGALPNVRTLASLHALERTLSLPFGHLAELLAKTQALSAPVHRNEYRERLRTRNEKYRLKPEELSDDFRVEWQRLLHHKCSMRTDGMQRHANGRWTPTSSDTTARAVPHITTFNGNHFGSANVLWSHVSSFLGYLRNTPSLGVLGVPPQPRPSLAWLVVPELLDSYLASLTERSGGLTHRGHAVFCTAVSALTHATHGFLTQSSTLVDQLSEETIKKRDWKDLCQEAHKTAREWKSSSTDVSRDPTTPIQFLLDQVNPLAPIFTAMERLRARGNAAISGSQEEALARRDELLLGLLISNPLRMKNIIELAVLPDNSGNVYQTNNAQWRLRLPRAAFKNGKRSSLQTQKYDVRIAHWLHPLLSDYVEHFRPVLARPTSPNNLFLSKHGNQLNDMSHCVRRLTRVLIPGSGGFGPHAFRHLVATDWLTRNPSDFLTVAELLNDSIEVVMKTYAHLKKDDALTRHADQLESVLPQYLRPSNK